MSLYYRTVEKGKIVKKKRKIGAKEALGRLMEKKGKTVTKRSKLKKYYEKGKAAVAGLGSFAAEVGQGVAKSAAAHGKLLPKQEGKLVDTLMTRPTMYGGKLKKARKVVKKKKRRIKPSTRVKPRKPVRKEVYYY